MKKFMIFPAALILTLSLFTGCGCSRQMPETITPSDATVAPPLTTTAPATEAATVPSTRPTEHINPTEPHASAPEGAATEGMIPESQATTPDGGMDNRARTNRNMAK